MRKGRVLTHRLAQDQGWDQKCQWNHQFDAGLANEKARRAGFRDEVPGIDRPVREGSWPSSEGGHKTFSCLSSCLSSCLKALTLDPFNPLPYGRSFRKVYGKPSSHEVTTSSTPHSHEQLFSCCLDLHSARLRVLALPTIVRQHKPFKE